jgi:hypothetical protein
MVIALINSMRAGCASGQFVAQAKNRFHICSFALAERRRSGVGAVICSAASSGVREPSRYDSRTLVSASLFQLSHLHELNHSSKSAAIVGVVNTRNTGE